MLRRRVVKVVIATLHLVKTIAIGASLMKTNISNNHNKDLHLPRSILIPIRLRLRAEAMKLPIINNNSSSTKVDFFSKDKRRILVSQASPSSRWQPNNVTYNTIVKVVRLMVLMAVFSAEYQPLSAAKPPSYVAAKTYNRINIYRTPFHPLEVTKIDLEKDEIISKWFRTSQHLTLS